MKAGAASVLAADIDPWAETAVRLNAELNGVDIAYTAEEITGRDLAADLCLAGDVFYDKSFAERLLPWFTALSCRRRRPLSSAIPAAPIVRATG